MDIRVPQKIDYKGYPIYVRNFGDTFEFLTVFNNEIYTYHSEIYPHLWRKILYKIGILKDAYTERELDVATKFTIRSAQIVLEELIKKHKK